MPRDRWYVSGCAARLSIVAGAGIGPDEGPLVGRQMGGREQSDS
jgi:hypothetical protein